ncbi:radical SAM protein [Paenibacillus sanguinis]|uniref:radical SAM protein n=1 Tax=Paenibacillus sanguinis TaxID=225906 RepID=UPI00035E8690|nr:radical SAM protein [Paenibacillus sanguinis]
MNKFIPNIYRLEIDITYLCTLKCFNCNRGISVAPHNREHNMTVDQIQKFIEQSLEAKHPWERIKLIGGEPTIHPQFDEILELLHSYKIEHNINLDLRVTSNGTTKYTQQKLDEINQSYPDVIVENSGKVDNFIPGFALSHVAPCDMYAYKNHNYKGCWIPEECGIGLNFSGFYPCSIGGSIARIFDLDFAIKNVKDINIEILMGMYNSLCSLCGMYHNIKVDDENIETIMSPTWQKRIDSIDNRYILSKF